MRPPIFDPWDFASYILFSLIAVALFLASFIVDTPAKVKLVTGGFAALCLAFYAFILLLRWIEVSKYNTRLSYDIYVNLNGYLATEYELEYALADVVRLYKVAYPHAEEVLREKMTFVTFVPNLLSGSPGGLAMGLTESNLSASLIKVCYVKREPDNTFVPWPGAPIASTAFGHEIAHVILGRSTGSWNPDLHHQLMEKVEGNKSRAKA